MTGIERIAAERQRQIDAEHWSTHHDDHHRSDELALAAIAYALPDRLRESYEESESYGPDPWPWRDFFKPGPDRIRELEKAGALIAAEIDRLLRLVRPAPTPKETT